MVEVLSGYRDLTDQKDPQDSIAIWYSQGGLWSSRVEVARRRDGREAAGGAGIVVIRAESAAGRNGEAFALLTAAGLKTDEGAIHVETQSQLTTIPWDSLPLAEIECIWGMAIAIA